MATDITEVVRGAEARKKILAGVNSIIEVIAPTHGPAGRSVLLPRTHNRGPRVVDDGYMAAENVLLKDIHERMAAEKFKEGIKKTNMLAGDGTTGTGIVSASVINKVLRELPDNEIPIVLPPGQKKSKNPSVKEIHKDLNDTKNLVIEEIKKVAKPVKTLTELEKIAYVSMNDDANAKLVAKLVWDVARDSNGDYINNHIEVTDGFKGEIEVEVIRGMRFPAKVSAPAFVNRPERHEMVAEDVPVLVTNYKLDNGFVIQGILERCNVPKIAIFAPEFSVGVLQYLAQTTKGGLHCFPIKCPSLRTEQMEDLAVYTGATVIDKGVGAKLDNVGPISLGFAEKIIVKNTENREDAVLFGGKGERVKRADANLIEERVKVLKGQLKECRNDIEKISLEKRIANLGSAIGIVRVGSSTEGEGLYLKLKIEDGVYACKGALEEGYVQGGGLCLKKIAEKLPENILTDALKAPHTQLLRNAGGDFEVGKDIVDPAKVVRLIVEHGVSVAATMITTHAIIAEVREESPAEGYTKIAKALNRYAYYWAKEKGMIKESQDEAEADRNKAWEEVMMGDK